MHSYTLIEQKLEHQQKMNDLLNKSRQLFHGLKEVQKSRCNGIYCEDDLPFYKKEITNRNLFDQFDKIIQVADEFFLDVSSIQSANQALSDLCDGSLKSDTEIDLWDYLQNEIIDKLWNFNYQNFSRKLKSFNDVSMKSKSSLDNNCAESEESSLLSTVVNLSTLETLTDDVNIKIFSELPYYDDLFQLRLVSQNMNRLVKMTYAGQQVRMAYDMQWWANIKDKSYYGSIMSASCFGGIWGAKDSIQCMISRFGNSVISYIFGGVFIVGFGTALYVLPPMTLALSITGVLNCITKKKFVCSEDDAFYVKSDREKAKAIREKLKSPINFLDEVKALKALPELEPQDQETISPTLSQSS